MNTVGFYNMVENKVEKHQTILTVAYFSRQQSNSYNWNQTQ